jgi:hypothetical protein
MLGLIIMVMGIFKMNVHNFLNQLPRTVARVLSQNVSKNSMVFLKDFVLFLYWIATFHSYSGILSVEA